VTPLLILLYIVVTLMEKKMSPNGRYRTSDEEFKTAVANSLTIIEVIRKLGLAELKSNYRGIHHRVRKLGLDVSHWRGKEVSRSHAKLLGLAAKRPLIEHLVENSSYDNRSLKNRLVKEHFMEYKCSKCGIGEEWEGAALVLHLDHINGVHDDNRIGNLRLLCPNCHSQTPTFSTKRSRRRICPSCGANSSGVGIKCKKCYSEVHPTKIVWPSVDELTVMVDEKPIATIAKDLGVSGSAVAKHCTLLGIRWKPRGYWAGKVPSKKATVTDRVLDGRRRRGEKMRKVGPNNTYWCKICHNFLPACNFTSNKSRWSGLSCECRGCRSNMRKKN